MLPSLLSDFSSDQNLKSQDNPGYRALIYYEGKAKNLCEERLHLHSAIES